MPKERKYLTIRYKGKVVNPKWIEHQNMIKSGWDTLDSAPKHFIKGDKEFKIPLPYFGKPGISIGGLLIDLFMFILPFVLIVALYNTDLENFDFFYYLEKFAEMQPNNTFDMFDKIMEYSDKLEALEVEKITFQEAKIENIIDFFNWFGPQFVNSFKSMGAGISQVFYVIMVPFTLLWDALLNIFAVMGLLFGIK